MAAKQMKDMAKMDSVQLRAQFAESLRDRVSLMAKAHAGTDPKAAQLARGIKKRIARLQTLLRQRESTQA